MAPEVAQCRWERTPYTYECDIFSTGLLLYKMTHRKNEHPFELLRHTDMEKLKANFYSNTNKPSPPQNAQDAIPVVPEMPTKPPSRKEGRRSSRSARNSAAEKKESILDYNDNLNLPGSASLKSLLQGMLNLDQNER